MMERVYVERSSMEELGGGMFKYSITYQNSKHYIGAIIAECWDREIAKAIGATIAEKMLNVNRELTIHHFSDRSETEVEVWYRD